MTFFESPVNSYTLQFSPPQPKLLWELPDSALESLCLPGDQNNAMFIAEPPTNKRQRTMKRSNGFVAEPYHGARLFRNENREITRSPHCLNQPSDYEIRMNPDCHDPSPIKTDSQIFSRTTEPSNDVPFHSLVEKGLKVRNYKRHDVDVRDNFTTVRVYGHAQTSHDDQGIIHQDVQNQPFLVDNRKIQRNPSHEPSHVKLYSVESPPSVNPAGDFNNSIPQLLLVQMGLAKPNQETTSRTKQERHDVVTVDKTGHVYKSNRKITDNAEAKKHFSTAYDLYAERILRPLELGENAGQGLFKMKDSKLFQCDGVPEDNTGSSNSGSTQCTHDIEQEETSNGEMRSNQDGSRCIEGGDTPSAGIGNENKVCVKKLAKPCVTGEGVEDDENLKSQSSLSQLFQSQEFDLTHYHDLMRCPSIGDKRKELAQGSALSPEQDEGDVQDDPDGRGNSSSESIVESDNLKVDIDKNVQPFVIRGCEPKMFDTSMKRIEDNPWKSEVRQGVLNPTEDVSNRDKREVKEIPMVVSPYFPNGSNYPIQEGKRTNLYTTSVSQDLKISSSQNDTDKDVFSEIFEYEASEEFKLCKDFFKQDRDKTVRPGTKKYQVSKKYKKGGNTGKKCGKITNYFPVIKTPLSSGSKSQPQTCDADKKITQMSGEHETVQANVSLTQAKLALTFHDSGDGSIKRQNDKLHQTERRQPTTRKSVPCDSRTFYDFGSNCQQSQKPTKHVFRDLPPGQVQSLSQLKTGRFDGEISGSTKRTIPSQSSPSFEMTANQAKIIDFGRTAPESASQDREIRIMEEEKIEQTALEMESSGDLLEIGFTLCYKEKFSVLNRPVGAERKSHHPTGIMSRVEFSGGKTIRIYQKVDELIKENSRSFLLCLLESNCRKVCFEAQAFSMFVLELLIANDDKICHDWLLLDPIVGVWLLDPDHPPHSFDCVLKKFNVKVDCCRNSSAEWKKTVSYYMDAQSEVIEKLYTELYLWNLWDVFYRMETPLTPILASMERGSIEVNYKQLKDISKVLQEKLDSLQQSAWTLVGKKFQLSSPLQLRALLYDELKLDEIGGVEIKPTASSGAKSTDEGMLKLLLGTHPLPSLILEYRHAHKIKSTYVDGILAHVVDKTSVSTTWEQCAAATGRITSSCPNLQSIPKQEENLSIGGERFNVRKIFVSRYERAFVAVDFQQIELRVFAHLSRDESLISAFKEPGDIFQTMTRIRIGKRDFEAPEREKTKTLTYALLYGAGAQKISELLSVDMENALQICSEFYAAFPGLKYFRSRVLEECRVRKELRSLSGRRRHFPNIAAPVVQQKRYAERQAVNFVIQGSAADICKVAMLRAEAALKKGSLRADLLLQIHDELVWEVPEGQVSRATDIIRRAISETKDYWSDKFNLIVDLPVKITSGKNWGTMEGVTERR